MNHMVWLFSFTSSIVDCLSVFSLSDVEVVRRLALRLLGCKSISVIDFYNLDGDASGALPSQPAASLSSDMNLDSDTVSRQAPEKFATPLEATVVEATQSTIVERAARDQFFYDERIIQTMMNNPDRPLCFLEQCRWSDKPDTEDDKTRAWLSTLLLCS